MNFINWKKIETVVWWLFFWEIGLWKSGKFNSKSSAMENHKWKEGKKDRIPLRCASIRCWIQLNMWTKSIINANSFNCWQQPKQFKT